MAERSSSGNTANDMGDLLALFDRLIPGDGTRWPSASRAGLDVEAVLQGLGEEEALFARALAAECRPLNEDAAVHRIGDAEIRRPAEFKALLRALYAEYYSSEPAHRAVVALAEKSPRDALPHFDSTLVATVVATKAGRRRL